MKRRTMISAGAVVVVGLGIAATGVTMATAGNDDTDTPISGDALSAPLPRRSPTPAKAA